MHDDSAELARLAEVHREPRLRIILTCNPTGALAVEHTVGIARRRRRDRSARVRSLRLERREADVLDPHRPAAALVGGDDQLDLADARQRLVPTCRSPRE